MGREMVELSLARFEELDPARETKKRVSLEV